MILIDRKKVFRYFFEEEARSRVTSKNVVPSSFQMGELLTQFGSCSLVSLTAILIVKKKHIVILYLIEFKTPYFL